MILVRCLIAAAVICGCGNDPPAPDPITPVEPANCATIFSFGNGRTCTATEPELNVCGAAATRACVSGWLCFDDAEQAFCGCDADLDCAGRADYVNKARAQRKIAPLAARCVQKRCVGAP